MKQKNIFTLLQRVMLLFVLLIPLVNSYGQEKVLAKYESKSDTKRGLLGVGGPAVINETNINSDSDQVSTLYSSPGLLLVISQYDSHIVAKFDEELPANQWSYIQLEGDQGLFDMILGGNLGDGLGKLLSTVLLGNQNIVVSALNSNNSQVFTTSSNDRFYGSQSRLFVDGNGKNILAIKPSQPYQKIKIVNKAISLVGLLNEYEVSVAKVFTYNNSTEVECGKPVGTSFDGSGGLGLSLLDVKDQKLGNAIDSGSDYMNTYSTLKSSGLLSLDLGVNLSQIFYYPNVSKDDASFNITLGFGDLSLLDLSLLGGIQVNAYNGNTLVYSKPLGSGVISGIDVLGLLRSNNKATIAFAPGKGFDRIEVKLNGGVDLSLLSNGLRIYDVERYGGDNSNCSNPLFEKPKASDSIFIDAACSTDLVEFKNADFPNWAVDGNNESAATLTAANAKLLGILGQPSSEGMIHMSWGNDNIPANTPTYIRIDASKEVLNTLLGAILGDLGNDLGTILLGNYFFDVDVFQTGNANSVLSRRSSTSFSGNENNGQGSVSIVQDKRGYYYLKVVPTTTYNSVKITSFVNPGLVTLNDGVFTMNVYDMCREINTTETLCGSPVSTSFNSRGIKVDLLGGLRTNKFENAIDGDIETYSLLQQGGLLNLTALGSVSQSFDFATPSEDSATFSITMQMATGAVDLNLLGGIEVIAYNGLQEVYRMPLTSGLVGNLNVLNLISKGEKGTLRFGPGRSFDRVELRVNQGVNLNLLGNGVKIYEVERFGSACPDPAIIIPTPTEKPFEEAICSGGLIDFKNVDFPFNAVDGNNESYASLVSSNGSILNLGATTSMIQMSTGKTLPANKTSYIRINAEKDVLDALLSGTLGKLVAGVGEFLLGNHIITVEAYNDDAKVLEAKSSDAFTGNAGGKVTLVQDTKGRYYLAVSPGASYNSVKISTQSSALLGTGGVKVLDVYDMCYEAGLDSCFPAQFTSWDQRGLTLGLGAGTGILKGAGVTNAYYAIDSNSSSYSQLTAGTLGVGASVYQAFYFNQPSLVGDELKVRLQSGTPGLLNATLLGSYKVVTYLGSTKVQEFTLEQGLIHELDLLALFQSGGIQTFTFDTTGIYDRVEIVASGLLNVSTSADLKIYEVKRVGVNCPEVIVPHPFEDPVCATELIDVLNANDVENVFDDNFDSFATIQSGAGFLLGIGEKEGVIELGYDHIVKGGTTSYVRFDIDEELLGDLLSGSLGGLVSDLVNTILLGNHYFTVEVKDENGVVILSGDSSETNSQTLDGIIRVMIDREGRTYLAITPNKDYKSVRITDKTKSIVGVTTPLNSMNIYSMCYEASGNTCQDVFATSYEYSGLSLGVEGITNYGVKYPERAIDDNSTHYSELSVGTLGLDSKVVQWFYFNTPSKAGEVVNIDFSTFGGTANIDLLGKIDIIAYKGDTEVERVDFTGGIVNGVNVLDLIENGKKVVLPFTPNGEYDRISISLTSLVGVNVGASLRIYNVSRTCQMLSERFTSWKTYKVNGDSSITSVKGGETVTYTIHVKNEGSADIATFSVKDILPQGVTFENASNGGSFDSTSKTLSFSNEDVLAIGETQSFTFTVKVNTDLEGVDLIKNIAVVSTDTNTNGNTSYPPLDNTEDPSAPDTSKEPGTIIDVDPTDSIKITKVGVNNTKNSNVASLNDELAYTISVTNNSNKAIRNFTIVDSFANENDVTIEFVNTGNAEIQGKNIIFLIPVLQPGETTEVQVVVKVVEVPSNTNGKLKNTATINYNSPIDGTKVVETAEFEFTTECTPITKDNFTVTGTDVVCAGLMQTLTASAESSYVNPVFRWYSDEDRTNLVHTGDTFELYPLKETTYYVTFEAVGFCFSGDAKEVVVEVLGGTKAPELSVKPEDAIICVGDIATLTATQGPVGTIYHWYLNGEKVEIFNDPIFDKDGNITGNEPFSTSHEVETTLAGIYTVRAEAPEECVGEESNAIEVTLQDRPTISFEVGGDGREIRKIITNVNTEISLPKATASNGTAIVWYTLDKDGQYTVVDADGDGNRKVKFDSHGTYTFYANAKATLNGCAALEEVIVIVYDSDACSEATVRKYATHKTSSGSIITGGVSNKENAIDPDPTKYSTITTGVGLLGIGTTWQNIEFDELIPAGTPVTIKLGKEYSGLVLAGGLSVVGIGENGLDIGVIKPVQGGLLDLLAADNVVEFTFVPGTLSGPKAYKGIRISQGSLVGVAQNAKVYGVYVTEQGPVSCEAVTPGARSNIQDVLHGVKDLGLGVASATASVSNPWNAVDTDLNSYAMISRGVAVLNAASLTVVFKQVALPNDELQIILETPLNPVLSLELIKGYTIQRYLGDKKVGPALSVGGDILGLKLLGLLGGYKDRVKVIVSATGEGETYEPFDRVQIAYGNVVGVLGDFTKVYDVSLVPTFMEGNEGTEDVLHLCHGGLLELTPLDGCTHFEVFTEQEGGDSLEDVGGNTGLVFDLGDLPEGKHTLWVQTYRNGCEAGPRVPLNVQVNETPVFDHYLLNGEKLEANSEGELAIKVHRGDKKTTLDVMPEVSSATTVAWEMKNVDDTGVETWIAIPFASVDATTGKLTMDIPRNGRINGVDFSGKKVNIRAVLAANIEDPRFDDDKIKYEGIRACYTYGDIIEVEIAKRSNVKTNLNVTQRIK
ncbi:Ig-like domain-containing protein [Myroides sp. LJL115]